MRALAAVLSAGAVLAAAVPAQAGDPVMPLSEVRSGMRCTGFSVIRGTDISSFDVEVLDVVAGASPSGTPRILVRGSGPAVDETGLGSGFSGSPIYCDGRVIGAVAQGTGDYGNRVVLATPIEEILGEAPDPPRGARHVAPARGLAAPLTISGLSPSLGARVVAAARGAGRHVLAAPAGPLGSFPAQDLRPGASVSAGFASGDLSIAAIGTVTYTDGDRVWAFGHPLEGAGARSLLLQDAYVFTVISNPGGFDPAVSYKLAAPGHTLGTLTNDAPAAVVGRTGPAPRTVPVRVVTEDLDSGRSDALELSAADEWPLGFPSGQSPVSLAAPLALVQGATRVARGLPSRVSARMCLRIELEERSVPIRFCNRYVAAAIGGDTGGLGLPLSDLTSALALLESYSFGPLTVMQVEANVEIRRGLRLAYLRRATVPRRVRRGSRMPVVVTARGVDGVLRRIRFGIRVPRSLRPRVYELRLAGSGPDLGGDELVIELEDLFGAGDEEDAGDPGATSVKALAAQIEGLERYDGIGAGFVPSGRNRAVEGVERAFRHDDLRFAGRARARFRVVR